MDINKSADFILVFNVWISGIRHKIFLYVNQGFGELFWKTSFLSDYLRMFQKSNHFLKDYSYIFLLNSLQKLIKLKSLYYNIITTFIFERTIL